MILHQAATVTILLAAIQSLCAQPATSYYNKTLIMSITSLLDTLLDPKRYDRKLRPSIGEGPIVVTTDMSVRSMGPISELDMEYSVDCYFRQKWTDNRLKFNSSKIPASMQPLPLAANMLHQIWRPDTFIRNGRQSYLHTLTTPNVLLRVNHEGHVFISQRFTIKARCPMYLRKYPMDTQACPLMIGSLGYDRTELVYRWNRVALDKVMGTELSQYSIKRIIKSVKNISDPRSDENELLSVLYVYFKLQRQKGYYILQVYTPCTLIVVMSWVSFWINKEASPARVALGVMTVLNMSTMTVGHRSDLPRVSYSTALDIYIVTAFAFVFAAMVEYAVVNFAHIVHVKKTIHQMRMLAGSMLGAGAVTAIGKADLDAEEPEADGHGLTSADFRVGRLRTRALLSRLCCRRNAGQRKRSMFYKVAAKAAKARTQLQMERDALSVNKIDSVAKMLFPGSFLLFNALYWAAFLYLIPDEIDSIPSIKEYLDA